MRMIYPTRFLPAGFQLAVLLAIVPSISAAFFGPKFLGCATDGFLTSAKYKDPAHMTNLSCRIFCSNRHYVYAGLENGEDCYCGNDKPKSVEIVSPDKCNVKCTGDSSESCGGSSYLDLYWTIIGE
ncbi:WSC domain-containing protein [Lactarius sanguifluus]|nr:WSC domain-containing protein [Lactarius sanguifluus]